jgi:hypothetical protein
MIALKFIKELYLVFSIAGTPWELLLMLKIPKKNRQAVPSYGGF